MRPHTGESVTYMAVEPPAEWASKRWVSLPHFNGPLDGVTRDVRISEFDDGVIFCWYKSDETAPKPNRCTLYELVWRWSRKHGAEGLALRWMAEP